MTKSIYENMELSDLCEAVETYFKEWCRRSDDNCFVLMSSICYNVIPGFAEDYLPLAEKVCGDFASETNFPFDDEVFTTHLAEFVSGRMKDDAQRFLDDYAA